MEYVLHIAVTAGIYVIACVALDLITGHMGLVSVCHGAVFAIGAYVAALLALNCHTSLLTNLGVAAAAGGVAGAVMGLPSLRVRSDAFVIVTFAFQMVFLSVLNNWVSMTGGGMGLPGIPWPEIRGWQIDSAGKYLLLVLTVCCATFLVARRLSASPYGLVLRAIREDSVFAAAAGKNDSVFKVATFIVATSLTALAGGLYAQYVRFIDPTGFSLLESIFMLSIVIIGGAGSLWGPVLGAVVLVTLPEVLRFVGMPSAIAANMRQILYGAALVACMLWRPQGFIGEYAFGRESRPK